MSATEDTILDAVGRVLARRGIHDTTIDAIAAEAGMTKGGVLYYFANKQELLQGIIEKVDRRIRDECDKIHAAMPARRRCMVRAAVLALFKHFDRTSNDANIGLGFMGDPVCRGTIGSLRKLKYSTLAKAAASRDGVATVLLILDGIWMNMLFESKAFASNLHDDAVSVLLGLADACCHDPAAFALPKRRTRTTVATVTAAPREDDSCNAILDAAERVLSQHGLANTTFDAVAREAGMSKGGVLHYFRNKRDMLSAIVYRFEKQFSERRTEIAASLPDAPDRFVRATFAAVAESRRQLNASVPYRLDMLEDEHYRTIISDVRKRMYTDLLKGSRRPEKVLVALYMMDGLWMHQFFSPQAIPAGNLAHARKWLDGYIEKLYEDYS